MSDDDFKSHRQYTDEAANEGFELVCFKSWDHAQMELDENFYNYQAVILDVQGMRDERSKSDDKHHVTLALNWLSAESSKGRIIPVVIFTGYYGTNEELSEMPIVCHVQDKLAPKSFSILLGKLREIIAKTPRQKIINRYPEFFSSFHNPLLNSEEKEHIIQILIDLDENKFKDDSYNYCRKLFESFLLYANQIDNERFLPNEFIRETGSVDLDNACKYVTGQSISQTERFIKSTIYDKEKRPVIATDEIRQIIWLIKQLTNIKSHHSNQPLTVNAFRACIFALMEFVIWFDRYTLENYPTKK